MVSSTPTEAELILRFPSTFPKFGSSIVGLKVVLSDGDRVGSKLYVGCEEGNVDDSSSIIDIGAYTIRLSSSYKPTKPMNGSYSCSKINMLRLTDFESLRSRVSGFEESLLLAEAEAEETYMYIDRAKKALKKGSSFMVFSVCELEATTIYEATGGLFHSVLADPRLAHSCREQEVVNDEKGFYLWETGDEGC